MAITDREYGAPANHRAGWPRTSRHACCWLSEWNRLPAISVVTTVRRKSPRCRSGRPPSFLTPREGTVVGDSESRASAEGDKRIPVEEGMAGPHYTSLSDDRRRPLDPAFCPRECYTSSGDSYCGTGDTTISEPRE